MKKLFSFFAAALMAVSMFAESFTLDFYDAEKLTATSGTNLTTDNYAQFVKVPDGKQASDYVSGIATTGTIRFGMNGGLTFGTGTAADDQLTITLATGVKVKKVTAYATLYDSGIFYLNNVKGTGTMGTKNSAIESVTSPLVWEDLSASSLVFSKKTNDSKAANCKRVTLLRVICEIEGGESSTDPELNVANTILLESNATEGAITYTISNPVAETAVVPTCTAEWISNLANDATNNKVTFTTTANEGAERTATVTLTYGSIVKEVAVTQKKYVKDYTSLPMTVAAGLSSAQVKELDGVTLVCDGTDYNNATNKVKMSKNTHYLQVKTDARPGVCTFSLKGAAGAGTSSFTLQSSVNGETWTNVEVLTAKFEVKDTIVEVASTKEFAEDVRYVKLAFNKATGEVNCGLGAFSIAEHTTPVVEPVVLNVAATAEAINVTTESTGKWYGNVVNAYYYSMYKSMGMTENMMVVSGADIAEVKEADLYTGNKSFAIADLTFNDAPLTEGTYYFIAGGLVPATDPESPYAYENNGEAVATEFTVGAPEPEGCDWDKIEAIGDGAQGGALTGKYKICVPKDAGINIVNIQNSFGTEAGIFLTCPSAVGIACSLPEGKYAIQGAGMLLYLSAFTKTETEFTVSYDGKDYDCVVWYADGKDVEPTTFTFKAGETGKVTITPSNEEVNYAYAFCNTALLNFFAPADINTEADLLNALVFSVEDISTIAGMGEMTVDIKDFEKVIIGMGASFPAGTYNLLVTALDVAEEGGELVVTPVGEMFRYEGVVFEKAELPEFKATLELKETVLTVTPEDNTISYGATALPVSQVNGFISMGWAATEEGVYELVAEGIYGDVTGYHFFGYNEDLCWDGADDYVFIVAGGTYDAKEYTFTLTHKPLTVQAEIKEDAEGNLYYENTSTGLNKVMNENINKMIENGELYIYKNGVRYTVVGAKF